MSVAGDPQKKVFTVTELTRQIKSLIETHFSHVWIEGEISGFKLHHSGHMYFSLKDANAVVKAAFFQRHQQAIRFELHDGLKVVCFGRISVYEPRGDYQIIVERIEPKGLGALQLALEQLKARLAKEGLFDSGRKRPIPSYPRKVGVVTSPTGAAIRDILNIVSRRFSGIHILVNPVRVQGEGSAEEISRAIDEMNRMDGIDVLIVGRGGGSLEDLWAFNEEVVVRAIHRSGIPVISAVGHEIDWTLADLVADLRAPTPSAAAELVTESRVELERRLGDYSTRLGNAVKNVWSLKQEKFQHLKSSYAFRQPLGLVEQWAQRLDEILRQMANYLKGLLALKDSRFKNLAGKLEVLSPLGVLARGYSITFDGQGQVVKKARDLRKGDKVKTRLSQGIFESEVLRSDAHESKV